MIRLPPAPAAGLALCLSACAGTGLTVRPSPAPPASPPTAAPSIVPVPVHSSAAPPPADGRLSPVEAVFVGDIMLAHRFAPVLDAEGMDYPFRRIRDLLAADVLFGNFENPASGRGDLFPDKKYNFLMAPRHLAALTDAGFDVVSLANNHVLDFGPEALMDTLEGVRNAGAAPCGAGRDLEEARRPAVVSAGGGRMAFLAYSHTLPSEFYASTAAAGTAFADESWVREDVARAGTENDWVIVSFHWGQEYSPDVQPHQRHLARAAVDAGADAVIGHHPHTIQGLEIYKGKVIIYSLGNFAFGTLNDKAKGALLRIRFSPDGASRAELTPLEQNNFKSRFQPRPFAGKDLEKALEEARSLSAGLGTDLRVKDGRLVWP